MVCGSVKHGDEVGVGVHRLKKVEGMEVYGMEKGKGVELGGRGVRRGRKGCCVCLYVSFSVCLSVSVSLLVSLFTYVYPSFLSVHLSSCLRICQTSVLRLLSAVYICYPLPRIICVILQLSEVFKYFL